jgi:hypothetical protein
LERPKGCERNAIDGRVEEQFNLYAHVHRERRDSLAIRNRDCQRQPNYHRQFQRQSEHDCEWKRIDSDLGREQCHCMRGRRIMVGQQSNCRFAIDGSPDQAGNLHVNLHGIRRQQRIAIGHCVGLSASTYGQSECQSQQRRQQWQQQFDLVSNQRDRLHGLGRMVRTEKHERIAVDWSTRVQQHLYVVLHRHRRHRIAISNGVRQAGRAYRQLQQQPQHSREGQ